jgi:hypothetical protein
MSLEIRGYGLILREWAQENLPAMRDLFDDPWEHADA